MRIGVYDPYLATLGGGEKYMLTAASCLSTKHEVVVFWDEKDILSKASERFDIDLSRVKITPNIFHKDSSLFSKLLTSRQFDTIFYLSDGSIPLLFCKLYLHFQFPVEWIRRDLTMRLKLSRVSEIICNSQFTKSYIDKKLQVASTVIYPPVDRQQEGTNKENIILHVGRLQVSKQGVNFKKQDVLVSMFKKLVDAQVKGWKLVLVVSYSNQDEAKFEEFKKMTEGYPIELFVNLDHHQLSEKYTKAKIYWHASGFGEDLNRHPHLAEHFGITTVEAMSAGCVPIVYAAGGQIEIVQNGKNGYLWRNEQEILDETRYVIQHDDLRKRMAHSAEASAAKFSKEVFTNKIIDVFR